MALMTPSTAATANDVRISGEVQSLVTLTANCTRISGKRTEEHCARLAALNLERSRAERQRQIAQLWDDKIAQCTPAARMETTFQFVSDPDLEESFSGAAESTTVLVPSKTLKALVVSSPDCRDTLSIVFDKPDFTSERVHVLISPANPTGVDTDYRFDFGLTSFAFPFTDNALLPNGNRFAFFIRHVIHLFRFLLPDRRCRSRAHALHPRCD